MTAPETQRRQSGVHPRLEPTSYRSAPFATLAAPTSPFPAIVPISWVLRGEFEVEMASEE